MKYRVKMKMPANALTHTRTQTGSLSHIFLKDRVLDTCLLIIT